MKDVKELLSAADHMIDWARVHNPEMRVLRLSPTDFATYEQHVGTHGIGRSGSHLTYRNFLLLREDQYDVKSEARRGEMSRPPARASPAKRAPKNRSRHSPKRRGR